MDVARRVLGDAHLHSLSGGDILISFTPYVKSLHVNDFFQVGRRGDYYKIASGGISWITLAGLGGSYTFSQVGRSVTQSTALLEESRLRGPRREWFDGVVADTSHAHSSVESKDIGKFRTRA